MQPYKMLRHYRLEKSFDFLNALPVEDLQQYLKSDEFNRQYCAAAESHFCGDYMEALAVDRADKALVPEINRRLEAHNARH